MERSPAAMTLLEAALESERRSRTTDSTETKRETPRHHLVEADPGQEVKNAIRDLDSEDIEGTEIEETETIKETTGGMTGRSKFLCV